MLRMTVTGLCAFWLFACASGPVAHQAPVQITGMVMENQTQMFVSAVRLLVADTGNFVSCGNISPQSMCSTSFPEATYKGNPVEITWSQGGQIYSTGPFVLQLSGEPDENKAAVVQVVISGPGSAGATLIRRPQ